MTAALRDTLARLRALHEKATQGEWRWDGDDLWHFGTGYADTEADPHRYSGIKSDTRLRESLILAANKELIAALHNAFPALAAALDRAQRVEEAAQFFRSGANWGTWKAWMVNGAATRDEGIAGAKQIVAATAALEIALAQPDEKESKDG